MIIKEEKPKGFEVSSDMKEIRSIQIKMVQKLLKVCQHHHLRIWADGGTLLGAVRHHGYIPWDDDIDMLMPRKDYDILLSIAPTEFQSPYFFQCVKTEKTYYKGHSQLRYDGTAAILESDIFLPIHQGLFIDIFVYDSIPEIKDEGWHKRIQRADKLFNRLYQYTYGYKFCFNPIAILAQTFNILYCKAYSTNKIFEKYENLFKYYDDKGCKLIACPCFNRKIFKTSTKQKEWYSKTVFLPFENISLPAPIDYDKVLRTQYGDDYMTPRKVPAMHSEFLILDAHQSYTEYLPKLRQLYKKTYWEKLIETIIQKFKK